MTNTTAEAAARSESFLRQNRHDLVQRPNLGRQRIGPAVNQDGWFRRSMKAWMGAVISGNGTC